MARRAAARINSFLERHVTVGEVEALRQRIRACVVPQIAAVPAAVAARIATLTDPGAVHALLDAELHAALERAAAEIEIETWARDTLPEPRAVARRSRTLATARAQNARLGARWIDLQQRVLPSGCALRLTPNGGPPTAREE